MVALLPGTYFAKTRNVINGRLGEAYQYYRLSVVPTEVAAGQTTKKEDRLRRSPRLPLWSTEGANLGGGRIRTNFPLRSRNCMRKPRVLHGHGGEGSFLYKFPSLKFSPAGTNGDRTSPLPPLPPSPLGHCDSFRAGEEDAEAQSAEDRNRGEEEKTRCSISVLFCLTVSSTARIKEPATATKTE